MQNKLIQVLTLLIVAAAFSTNAYADSKPGNEEFANVLNFLASEQFTPSRLELETMTSDAVQKLVKVAKTKRYPASIRSRAIQTLALYRQDRRATDMISTLMRNTRPNKKVFPAVLVAYAEVHGEDAADEVAAYTRHTRTEIRLAAVIALGRYCGQPGLDFLRDIAGEEENDAVRSRIEFYAH